MAQLDVRPDIEKGGDPFNKIMVTVNTLKPGETLEVIAPFEPFPLYDVMESKGFTHSSEPTPDGSWKVVFTRRK
ncbi:MAG: DUF2249 domain-containing protein [Chloroflexi bacterium]|nr:DUF2249 domain-containing protein [Chloroflexota bacterium]